MTLEEAQKRAAEIRELYSRLEEKLYGREWSTQELMLGFLGDVGDLAKLIQGAVGVRESTDLEEKLAHELADCLWSVFVLADRLGFNIGEAYDASMSELERNIRVRLDAQH
jgi:NTP pyrophosphatase (non-canonical NTP hydrolase)